MNADLLRFGRELAADPALGERILAELPPVEERVRVTLRTDTASVDAAICKALVLAVEGIEARIEVGL